MTTGVERRRAQRHTVILPLRMPNGGSGRVFGITRDVSSGGLFFYTEMEKWKAGNPIEFVFQFPPEVVGKSDVTVCRGTVVRTETAESVRGLAVRIERISFVNSA